ncbi:hypothetical protein MUP79_09585 [Candidatus Bathyarchaeota archaeon]|nr:hypothetical protein [Candidatus Bathyarchaeota archaeon]
MNRNKVVEMYCQNCKQIIPSEPTIIMQKDGGNRMEMRGPKKCPYCNTGLQRHVTKVN